MKKITINKINHTLKPRVTWGFNPTSRVVSSKKIYSRKSNKQKLLEM